MTKKMRKMASSVVLLLAVVEALLMRNMLFAMERRTVCGKTLCDAGEWQSYQRCAAARAAFCLRAWLLLRADRARLRPAIARSLPYRVGAAQAAQQGASHLHRLPGSVRSGKCGVAHL